MRQVEIEDLYPVFLTKLRLSVPESPFDIGYIDRGLQLRVDLKLANEVVRHLIGTLSYRNREQIIRLLERLTGWIEGDESHQQLDLIRYWSDIAATHLEYRDTYYIKTNRYERWRRYTHALDEDLPTLCHLVREHGEEIKSPNQLYLRLARWPTFLRGDEPQLYRDLAKGVACLHLHLSGSYPAPYFWVALMNGRFQPEDVFESVDQPSSERGYRDRKLIETIKGMTKRAMEVRFKLFKYLQKAGLSGDADDSARAFARTESAGTKSGDELDSAIKETLGSAGEGRTDYVQSMISGRVEDALCPSLIGERWLNYGILAALVRRDRDEDFRSLAQAYWSYVESKNTFLSLAQQAEGTSGFDYFEHTFRMIRWDKPHEVSRCATEIGRFLQESGAVVKLELMIAPKKKSQDYQPLFSLIRQIGDTMQDRLLPEVKLTYPKVKVGTVVHFIKDRGIPFNEREKKDAAYLIFHHKRRDDNLEELANLAGHLENTGEKEIPLLAIDTANRELYCPPEIFGELYKKAPQALCRFIGSGKSKPIGKTCHVGEDFASLMTGLRRIYEAITFLDLRSGDRLGHAVALGVDAKRWLYHTPTVNLHLIDILDDAVFEWSLLQLYPDGADRDASARLTHLQRVIERYSARIFGEPVLPYVLEAAWRRRGEPCYRATEEPWEKYSDPTNIPEWVALQGKLLDKLGKGAAAGLQGSHSVVPTLQSLVSVGAERKLWKQEDYFDRVSLPSDMTERILMEYLYDKRTIRKFTVLDAQDVSQEAPNIKRVQAILRRILTERGITIESNPTSNWLIGGFERHADVPAVQWLLHHPDTAITVNPDDPTVFSTSIENEFFFVYAALVHGTTDPLSRSEALDRIKRLRDRAMEASFLD